MVSIKTYEANSVTEKIAVLRDEVNRYYNPQDGTMDLRIRALINTKLQEAEMLSLLLFGTEG